MAPRTRAPAAGSRTVTHYEVLGVDTSATATEIKRAYYRRARAYHPDSHAGSSTTVLDEAERSMAQLNAAWNVLRDERLRAEYDRALTTALEVIPGNRGRRRTKDNARRRTMELGAGFHYWMGSAGLIPTDDGTSYRMSLMVDGATDFTSLRGLPPRSVFALNAARSAINDEQLAHVGELAGLQVLDLSDTTVGDAGMLHLLHLERLEHLWLWGTRITDAGVALLGRIPSLRLLGLGDTRVTDAGLAGLADLRRLRTLQLSGTSVSGPGLAHLHGITDLERVTLPGRVGARHRRRLKLALARNAGKAPVLPVGEDGEEDEEAG
jgi:DnaJ-domain-containing protein 1